MGLKDGASVMKAYEIPKSDKPSNLKFLFDMKLPDLGTVETMTGRYDSSKIIFNFHSFLTP